MPQSWRFSVMVCALLALCFVLGACGRREEPQPTGVGEGVPPYPAELSGSSSPREVAQVLIRGLDQDDKQLLLSLAATKAGKEEVEKIFAKYGKRAEIDPRQAASLAVSGWQLSYAMYREGATQVTDATVEGDTALVEAVGTNTSTGKPRYLTIKMVREDGVWKVAAGLQSRQP